MSRQPAATSGTFERTANLWVGAAVALVALAVSAVLIVRPQWGAASVSAPEGTPVNGPVSPATGDPVVAAAGDIACDPGDPGFAGGTATTTACRMRATADLLAAINPTAVLSLGDNQYGSAERVAFEASYGPSWGRLKERTRPVPGNHEYGADGARGYFEYFGAAAGDPAKGYYSFDLGSWHLVALNSSCRAVGGCQKGSPQERWLRADLQANKRLCTLAYWHHPRWSSGSEHGSDPTYAAFWQALYEAGAEVVLNGHDHNYERFGRQTPDGEIDTRAGIRQFVVGTGGASLRDIAKAQPNSVTRNSDTFGVLMLQLHPADFDWTFVPEAGKTYHDRGTGQCH
jgi:hypothetical protein